MQKKAFTLIETILVVVVLGISLPPLCILIVNVVQKNVLSQVQATATSLAEREMERVTALRFSGVNCEPQTALGSPFSTYAYKVDVDYVNAADLNTSVGQPSLCASAGGTTTNYKRVQITVSHSITGDLKLTTLVTNN